MTTKKVKKPISGFTSTTTDDGETIIQTWVGKEKIPFSNYSSAKTIICMRCGNLLKNGNPQTECRCYNWDGNVIELKTLTQKQIREHFLSTLHYLAEFILTQKQLTKIELPHRLVEEILRFLEGEGDTPPFIICPNVSTYEDEGRVCSGQVRYPVTVEQLDELLKHNISIPHALFNPSTNRNSKYITLRKEYQLLRTKNEKKNKK
jgi:hypothetical protein